MQAKDICVGRVLYLEPSDNLAEARRIFVTTKATKIPVFEDGSLVGAITELEVAKAYAMKRGPIEDVKVSEVMSNEIGVVAPNEDLGDVVEKLSLRPFLVVMDSRGFYGIITKTDVLQNILPLYGGSSSVAKAMKRDVKEIGPDQSIFKAAKVMVENRIKHLLVRGAGQMEGIISAKDIALSTFGLRPEKIVYTRESGEGPRRAVKVVPQIVGSIMKTPVLSVKPKTEIRKASKMMLSNGVGSLLVVDGNVIQGILTKTDVLNVLKSEL